LRLTDEELKKRPEDSRPILLSANLDGDQLGGATGVLDGLDCVFGCESAHRQRQLAVGGGLNGSPIDALHVFRSAGTAAVYPYKKLRIGHGFSFPNSGQEKLGAKLLPTVFAAWKDAYSFTGTFSEIR
jgi:hypothetical protein